jgi:SAM-dependent methyltransferase
MKQGVSLFRSFYYRFYAGNKYYCNICEKGLKKFIDAGSNERICPSCLSTSKDRSLWSLLISEFIDDQDQILHLSPAKPLKRNLETIPNIYYISSDYLKNITKTNGDIFAVGTIVDDSFNVIICSKILEYLNDVTPTVKQIFRLLKKGGHCIIQTNIKYQDQTDTESIKTYDLKKYSVSDLEDILSKEGFKTEIIEQSFSSENKLGLRERDFIIIAEK